MRRSNYINYFVVNTDTDPTPLCCCCCSAHPPSPTDSVTMSKNFKPRTDDVIITTFHKTGTTWMQQICHQLRTKGKGTDSKEITEVMPWIDFGWEIDQGTYCLTDRLTAIHSSSHPINPQIHA